MKNKGNNGAAIPVAKWNDKGPEKKSNVENIIINSAEPTHSISHNNVGAAYQIWEITINLKYIVSGRIIYSKPKI